MTSSFYKPKMYESIKKEETMMIYQGNKDIYKVTKDNVEDYANKFLLFFCKDAIFTKKQ